MCYLKKMERLVEGLELQHIPTHPGGCIRQGRNGLPGQARLCPREAGQTPLLSPGACPGVFREHSVHAG